MNNAVDVYQSADIAQQNLALAGVSEKAAEQDRIDLNSLVGMLLRRRTLFVLVMVTVFTLGGILTFRQTPVYTAAAQVVIDTSNEQVTPLREQILTDSGATSSPVVDTEVQVIMSDELANRVAESLNLDKLAAFDATQQKPGRRQLLWAKITGNPIAISPRSYDPQAQREYVVNTLKNGLQVARVGATYALSISFTSADPAFSARIANEYSKQYTEQALDRKRDANTRAREFLSRRIEELRKQALLDTEAVQSYRIAHNLLSTNASQLTEAEVSVYNQQVAGGRAAAAEDQARLATARQQLRSGSNGDDVGEALNSGVVSGLRTQRAQLAAQLAELNTRYGPLHPDVQRAKEQLANLDESIQAEINRVISNLRARTNVSQQRLGSFADSLAGARGTLQASNKALVGFDDLTRKAETSQGLYEAYLNRFKQAAAQEGTEQPDARITTFAQIPVFPSSPNIPLNMFLSLVLGLGAALASAFTAELAFRGMTTGGDVERRLGVPYLGAIPLMKSVLKWKGPPADAIMQRPNSAFAESFRSLKTSINYSVDAVVQIVAITSALPEEGKSTTALGLARVSALGGERVLLIDCDLRRRSLNRLIEAPREAGLIEVLRGEARVEDALVADSGSSVWLLPFNASSVDPGDLLVGDAFQALLNDMRAEFTYIILDLAPVLPVADSRVLATMADAVVFVARWRKTSDHALSSALRLMPRGRINLAGVALTKVDIRGQSRFGFGDPTYYYHKYKGYYG